MNFIFREDDDFIKLWNKFIENNLNTSWVYLEKWIKYQDYYSDKIIEDLSFIIEQDNQVLAVCKLFLENIDGNNYFSFSNSYLTAPQFKTSIHYKYLKKIQKSCFKKIDELANQYNVKKSMFQLDPLSIDYSFNLLMKYGYIDSSINTSILDLSKKKENIWSNLRSSYKSLINNGKNKFDIIYMDSSNSEYSIFNEYKELHHKSAGRITRAKETWELQYEMLQDDNAIIIGLKYGERFVAFSYFFHNNGKVYYGSSSDDPDYQTDIPLEHIIIWSAIEYFKKRNFKLFEIGHQQFGQQVFSHPSSKDINLSFFKRGFGGEIVTLYSGIKYYDDEYMKNELRDNILKINNKFNL